VIAGATLAILGLTWGGTRYSWASAEVLAPLLIGVALLAVFVVYELYVPAEPTVPFRALANRTSAAGFIGTAIHGITSIAIICALFRLPLFDQPR
jgi:hypothetical protein